MRSGSRQTEKDRTTQTDVWLYVDEITHRTLNDYTAMLAIVGRAARAVSDPTSGQALADVATRLRAAAARCHALKRPTDRNLCELDRELESLCAALSDSILSSRGITLTLSSDHMTLAAHRCWQISLIISELVTNAARHAFRRREMGSVRVNVRVCDDTVRCVIIDDGVADNIVSPGLGTAIVNELIGDLAGTITRSYTDKGSTIAFCVPLSDPHCLPERKLRCGAGCAKKPGGFGSGPSISR